MKTEAHVQLCFVEFLEAVPLCYCGMPSMLLHQRTHAAADYTTVPPLPLPLQICRLADNTDVGKRQWAAGRYDNSTTAAAALGADDDAAEATERPLCHLLLPLLRSLVRVLERKVYTGM